MDKQELGEIILGLKKDPDCKSTLQLALNAARGHLSPDGRRPSPTTLKDLHCDRIQNDSQVKDMLETDVFCGILLYLISLEQIGAIFFKGGKGRISDVLKKYCDSLNDAQIEAIQNLRNALAHSFGLINVNLQGNPVNKFTISYEMNESIIECPDNCYKDYSDKHENSSTKVYAFSLSHMVDEVFDKIVEDFKMNHISILADPKMVKARYTICSNK